MPIKLETYASHDQRMQAMHGEISRELTAERTDADEITEAEHIAHYKQALSTFKVKELEIQVDEPRQLTEAEIKAAVDAVPEGSGLFKKRKKRKKKRELENKQRQENNKYEADREQAERLNGQKIIEFRVFGKLVATYAISSTESEVDAVRFRHEFEQGLEEKLELLGVDQQRSTVKIMQDVKRKA